MSYNGSIPASGAGGPGSIPGTPKYKRKAQSAKRKRKRKVQRAKLKELKNMEKNQQLKYRAYKFSVKIVKFTGKFSNKRIFWSISDQLIRSATSIGANIIEAQAASSKRDFIRFYEIALKSANETKYWLALLRDATDVDKKEINQLLKEANEISKILGASLLTLKGKR